MRFIKALNSSWDILEPKVGELDIKNFINLLEDTYISKEEALFVTSHYASALIPLEPLTKKKVFTRLSRDEAFNYLVNNHACLMSIDSSYYNSSPHTLISFLIINVGWWIRDYVSDYEDRGSEFHIYPFRPGDNAELIIKSCELRTLKELLGKAGLNKGLNIYMFLDEALNSVFTTNWASDVRDKYVMLLRELITYLISKGILPIAVFYTRAHDVRRGLLTLRRELEDKVIDVSDRLLMNKLLDRGERSQLFYVYSRAITNLGIHLVAFYLKVAEGDIVRVEFPYEALDDVDTIHKVVLSAIILGNGFPLPMIRAHEEAVITYDLRRFIDEEISRRLKLPSPELLMSGKARSKRWGLV